MKYEFAMIAAVSVLASSTIAKADAYCSGLTIEALVYSNGDVTVYPDWRNQWITVCNLNNTRNGITPQTCFGWFSTINSSILYNKSVGYYFTGVDPSACTTMATYENAPVPYYVRLTK